MGDCVCAMYGECKVCCVYRVYYGVLCTRKTEVDQLGGHLAHLRIDSLYDLIIVYIRVC